jgi:hypothetical protein
MVEHQSYKLRVAGSNPAVPISYFIGLMVQWLSMLVSKTIDEGSNPSKPVSPTIHVPERNGYVPIGWATGLQNRVLGGSNPPLAYTTTCVFFTRKVARS